jgi:hypothetical protein
MVAIHPTPMIQPPFRGAMSEDAGTLAEFVEFASEGLAICLWSKMAGAAGDPWSIGRERVRSETGNLSYRNAVITELAGRPASGLIRFVTNPSPFQTRCPRCLYRYKNS